jgi:hypothetical protein
MEDFKMLKVGLLSNEETIREVTVNNIKKK